MQFLNEKLSDAEFKKFSDLIFEKTGIFLKAEKKELLNARLGKRLRACQINSFKEYFQYLINDHSGEELIEFINSVSTNFTCFFREANHFSFLTSTALPALLQDSAKKKREITLWSAACSSGEEPYTLTMVMDDFFAAHPGWRWRIMATDISTRVLAQAQTGVYTGDRIEKVPQAFLRKYFQKGVGRSAGYVKVKDAYRSLVSFQRFNLMDSFPWHETIDIIFCRNVMIYFNRETQQALVEKFYQCLAPGGYLFIGHSESITGINHKFTQIEASTYRK